MNKSDGGKQRKQRDTMIPLNNPGHSVHDKVQKMTNEDGTPKGLRSILTVRGFDVRQLQAKCSPVTLSFRERELLHGTSSFTARWLRSSNQESMLEILIKKTGHLCIFLPKFHCELNPIEMVSGLLHLNVRDSDSEPSYWQYWGSCKYRYRERQKKKTLLKPNKQLHNFSSLPQADPKRMKIVVLSLLGNFSMLAR
jgi:hypothetical protein